MPIYQFSCDDCKHNFDIVSSMSNYSPNQTCPECQSDKVHREYDAVSGFVRLADNEITNLGHLAQRNTENMSSDQKAALHEKHNAYKYTEPTRELPKGMSRIRKPYRRK